MRCLRVAKNKINSQKRCQFLLQQQGGMALLITVMTVSLLVAVTLQYHKTTWQQFLVSNQYMAGNQLRVIAESGINIGMALLEQDGRSTTQEGDSLLEDWATTESDSFDGLFPAGSLQLQIADLSGRIQVNSLVQADIEEKDRTDKKVRSMLQELLLSGNFPVEDETEARTIIDSLIDWIDEDDKESDLGAESSYYQSQDRSYSCRNGPVQYIEELLLVKGITSQLLFGSEDNKGLAEYITVTGENRRVNLNTAPLPVIRSFDPSISDDLLEKFDEFRRDIANLENLDSLIWYREKMGGWPGDIVLEKELLTSKSSFFQITATGTYDTLSRSVIAVVERLGEDEPKVKLLGKKTE